MKKCNKQKLKNQSKRLIRKNKKLDQLKKSNKRKNEILMSRLTVRRLNYEEAIVYGDLLSKWKSDSLGFTTSEIFVATDGTDDVLFAISIIHKNLELFSNKVFIFNKKRRPAFFKRSQGYIESQALKMFQETTDVMIFHQV